MSDRAWVEVDLSHLEANARVIQSTVPDARLLPMVKADGYGVGAVQVARTLEKLDPWGYGVAVAEEGLELRESGISRPILVFTPPTEDAWPLYRDQDLRAVIDRPDLANAWHGPFHLEVDTGMARCGLRWDRPDLLRSLDSEHLEGVFTHFHSAETDPSTVELQWERFQEALEVLPRRPELVHAANSAGTWRLGPRLDLLRPGMFIYGGALAEDLPIPQPVVSLRARVVSVREVHEGDTVSYGAEWTAPARTRIATLGVGYGDGVPWSLPGQAHVLLRGRPCPVVGRVTMDMIMVDVGDGMPDLQPGETATLIGSQGGEEITLNQFADWCGTISYEVLTRLGARLGRDYSSDG